MADMEKMLGDHQGLGGPRNSASDMILMVQEAISQMFGFEGPAFDGGNLLALRRLATALDSAMFLETEMTNIPHFANAFELLQAAFQSQKIRGLVLEFGVFSGKTINFIASLTELVVFGFDSFEGLPEDWRPDFRAGTFKANVPEVSQNVRLIVGYFSNTLPAFLAEHPGPISFLHVDCDLYSSTTTIFELCAERISKGTIIVFDEYFNYYGWRNGEYKAFLEYIQSSGYKFEYLGVVPTHQQVAVRIL